MESSDWEKRFREIEIAHAKTATELTALREGLLLVAKAAGMDQLDLMEFILKTEKEKWSELLEFVEDSNPALSAEIDTRTVDEIPIDDETK